MLSTRTPWQVTRSVWQALFIHESLARIVGDRLAWFWMLFEPIALILVMTAIRTLVMGGQTRIGGAEFVPWMLLGLFGFYLFRENMMRPLNVIQQNRQLFAYRQVKPVDTVLVRCAVETLLKTFIFLLFILAGLLLELDLVPDQPLMALFIWGSLWLLGLGAGLICSALAELVPEFSFVARIISMPLLLISGVILPLNLVPHHLLVYVMWNPIVHGLELLRQSFYDGYHMVHGVSLLYLWYWILTLLLLGLMLHLRFEQRLKRR
jgi:capsular polysaccharide transport system permease protein